MKRALALSISIFICIILINPLLAQGESTDIHPDFSRLFDEHGAIMLLIEPETGSILYANSAASVFYGYTATQLTSMKITQINMLNPDETAAEMQSAVTEHRNYFEFRHRLSNGEVRNVEVYSYPVSYNDRDALFSIVHDVTANKQLEEKQKQMTAGIFIAGGIFIAILLFLLYMLAKNHRELKASKEEIENFNALRKSFIDADDSLIYLKDENVNYVFVNKAFEAFHQKTSEDIIGLDDYALAPNDFALRRRQTDLAVLERKTLLVDEVEFDGRIYKTTKFPVRMLNGRLGVGAYIKDITEERENEKKQAKILHRNKIMVDVLNRSFASSQEQLDYVLRESLELTESQYGYIYLYDEEDRVFTLNSWTSGVMEKCRVTRKQATYQLEKTGIWGEVVRQRSPIVVNNFKQHNPLKKGYPVGHVVLKKFMSVPVIIDEKIVAVVGLANKESDYNDFDVYEMTLLMNGIWNTLKRREAQEKLAYERNKYLQTLISIGDGVMVIDQHGRIEMLNKVAQKLTGWTFQQAQGQHYKNIFVLSHEQEGFSIEDPIEGVFATDIVQELGNHAVLTSRDGTKYNLEDSAAPIKNETNTTVGVVLVFRDVTDKKEQRKKIEFLSFHDSLTGLYNRRFFEEELCRLDTERNLPLSIIIGDVNGLKITNDIFGHSFGDMLLKKVAEVLQNSCRSDDIIARWGGDEFVILLPRTGLVETEKIVARIKGEFAKEQIKAIKGSISMGFHAKHDVTEDIMQVLNNAEEKMYVAKALERDKVQKNVIDAIITTLHENNPREKDHSLRVSELCQEMGRALELPEVEIRKLKKAGYLHNIGRIVLEQKLFPESNQLTNQTLIDIKKHLIAGYRILNSFYHTADLAEPVLAHHEHWDGHGYPKGLKGEEIPLLARIIAVAEYYDRITHASPNNKAMNKIDALCTIRENSGTRFDPKIVELFANIVE